MTRAEEICAKIALEFAAPGHEYPEYFWDLLARKIAKAIKFL